MKTNFKLAFSGCLLFAISLHEFFNGDAFLIVLGIVGVIFSVLIIRAGIWK